MADTDTRASRSGRALVGAALAVLASAPAWAQPFPRPLGTATVISGPEPCDGQQCWRLEVACPEVRQAAEVQLKLGEPEAQQRGTILFMTGGGGMGFWGERFGPEAQRVLAQLRRGGFRTVELSWLTAWLAAANGEIAGQSRLACRPATVARWVYDSLHGGPAFCATGNSGGAAQTSYMLADYGLAEIIQAAVPTGGPPMGRIDLGCLREGPNPGLWYDANAAATLDRGYGFLTAGTGPCSRRDPAFRRPFERSSLALGPRAVFYPATMVWFVFGELDGSSAVQQGLAHRDRLLAAGSPLVRTTVVPDTPHATPSTRQGANTIRDILWSECRPR